MSSNVVVGIRHLEDFNQLDKNLFDAPLKEGQEFKAKKMAGYIKDTARRNNFRHNRKILVLFTS